MATTATIISNSAPASAKPKAPGARRARRADPGDPGGAPRQVGDQTAGEKRVKPRHAPHSRDSIQTLLAAGRIFRFDLAEHLNFLGEVRVKIPAHHIEEVQM